MTETLKLLGLDPAAFDETRFPPQELADKIRKAVSETSVDKKTAREEAKAQLWAEAVERLTKIMAQNPEDKKNLSGKSFEDLLLTLRERLAEAAAQQAAQTAERDAARMEADRLKNENDLLQKKLAAETERLKIDAWLRQQLANEGFAEKTEEALQYFYFQLEKNNVALRYQEGTSPQPLSADGKPLADPNNRKETTAAALVEQWVGFMRPKAGSDFAPLRPVTPLSPPKPANELADKLRRHTQDMDAWVKKQGMKGGR